MTDGGVFLENQFENSYFSKFSDASGEEITLSLCNMPLVYWCAYLIMFYLKHGIIASKNKIKNNKPVRLDV